MDNVLYEIITQALGNANNMDVIGTNSIHLVETRTKTIRLLENVDKSNIDSIRRNATGINLRKVSKIIQTYQYHVMVKDYVNCALKGVY